MLLLVLVLDLVHVLASMANAIESQKERMDQSYPSHSGALQISTALKFGIRIHDAVAAGILGLMRIAHAARVAVSVFVTAVDPVR